MHARLDKTVEEAIRRYGFTVRIDEACEIVGCSPATWRDKVRKGRYPRPHRRGVWPTEAVVRAMEKTDDQNAPDEFDPFDIPGPIPSEEGAERENGVVFLPRPAAPAR